MNAAAYVRVSSRAQTYETQRSAIERAAAARGDTITRWYEEKRSAKTLERVELALMRADARRGDISRIYVFRVDRLGRSGIRDMFEVVDELRSHGCELVTIADGFDLNGTGGEIVLAVLAWAAKMERFAIGERIAAARERVEADGGRWGRPRRLDRATVDKVVAARLAGDSIRTIARNHKIPRATVHAYLVGPSKKGRVPSNKPTRRRASDSPSKATGQ